MKNLLKGNERTRIEIKLEVEGYEYWAPELGGHWDEWDDASSFYYKYVPELGGHDLKNFVREVSNGDYPYSTYLESECHALRFFPFTIQNKIVFEPSLHE